MRADNCTSVPRLLFTSISERRKEGVKERQKGGRKRRKAGKEERKGRKGNHGCYDNRVAEGSRLMHVSKMGIEKRKKLKIEKPIIKPKKGLKDEVQIRDTYH